jgi:hypothetical protein
MRCVARFSLGVAYLAATVYSPALAGGGSNTRTDPCALVTAAEVAEALGEAAGPGESSGIGDCQFRGRSGYASTVSISVDENPGRRTFFESQAARGNVTEVENIGDGAFAFKSSAGFIQITVIKGETLMSVMVAGGSRSDLMAATTDLARQAAERLGSEAVLAKVPGLEALVGRWLGDAGDPARGNRDMRSWVIEADGSWVMTSAPEHGGILSAQDGEWRMESLQESFAGTYEIEDEDSFSTSGAIEAEWTRVAEGDAPAGIDPDFLRIWTQAPPGSTPGGPVEPTMIGLWQATLEDAASPTILVWRIPPAGFAALTEIITLSGELSAENGKMELLPETGEPIAVTYRLQDPDAFLTTDEAGTIRWQRRGTGLAPQ